VVLESLRSKGAAFTSSFEAETGALDLAVDWLLEEALEGQRYLICTDSLSLLAALDSGRLARCNPVASVSQKLRNVRGSVSLQWVPGHSGFPGNELADQAAKEAATDGTDRFPRAPVSFAAAKALVKRSVADHPPERPLSLEVYSGAGRIEALQSRRMEVAIARLRSGHSTILTGYRYRIGLADSPVCPRCQNGDEDLRHWLCQCTATITAWVGSFGEADPPLSVLRGGIGTVASYLRRLRLP
jgi:ribonuclease HI